MRESCLCNITIVHAITAWIQDLRYFLRIFIFFWIYFSFSLILTVRQAVLIAVNSLKCLLNTLHTKHSNRLHFGRVVGQKSQKGKGSKQLKKSGVSKKLTVGSSSTAEGLGKLIFCQIPKTAHCCPPWQVCLFRFIKNWFSSDTKSSRRTHAVMINSPPKFS